MPKIGTPLYSTELETVLGFYNATFLNYDELPKYSTIFDIFEDNNFRILYIGSDNTNVGHWVTILARSDTQIEWFDSLGYPPDGVNKLLNDNVANQNKAYYTELIRKTPEVRTIFNTVKLQSLSANTCGKWVLARILSIKTKLPDFLKLMGAIQDINLDMFIDKMYTVPELYRRN